MAKFNIEWRAEQYTKKANKGRHKLVFELGDWVWLHLPKERFPEWRKFKLLPQGDGPFQVLERINDNTYKLDLPGEYNVSATFNIFYLSPFDAGDDLMTNLTSYAQVTVRLRSMALQAKAHAAPRFNFRVCFRVFKLN